MSAPAGGNGGQPTPNATVGSVHSRTPIGAVPAKATAKQLKQQAKPAAKKAPKRKR